MEIVFFLTCSGKSLNFLKEDGTRNLSPCPTFDYGKGLWYDGLQYETIQGTDLKGIDIYGF